MSGMQETGIILSASPYRFNDEKTGEVREGVSLYYLNVAELMPKKDVNGNLGIKPLKASIPLDKMRDIIAAPGIYNLHYSAVSGKNMRMEMKLDRVSYIGDCFAHMLAELDTEQIDEYFTAEVIEKINKLGGVKK